MIKKINLQISHRQIQLYSVPFCDDNFQWDDKSLEQGVLINYGCVVFDPLGDGSYDADVFISKGESYMQDPNVVRSMVVPFYIVNKSELFLGSVIQSHLLDIELENTMYSVYFELCGDEEIYYNIKFVPDSEPKGIYLLDDPFGGLAGQELYIKNK